MTMSGAGKNGQRYFPREAMDPRGVFAWSRLRVRNQRGERQRLRLRGRGLRPVEPVGRGSPPFFVIDDDRRENPDRPIFPRILAGFSWPFPPLWACEDPGASPHERTTYPRRGIVPADGGNPTREWVQP